MTYYGFDLGSRKCMFTANMKPADMAGIVVLVSQQSYMPNDIELGGDAPDYFIREVEVAKEFIVAEAKAKKEQALLDANNRLAILCTVNKADPSSAVEAKIAEWEAYIAKVYMLDVLDPTVCWPAPPTLI